MIVNDLKFLIVDLPEDVSRTIAYGDFDKALKLIDLYMARNIPQILKDRLDFEKIGLEGLKRIIPTLLMKHWL